MISAFGVDHGISKRYDPKKMRVEREPDGSDGTRFFSGYKPKRVLRGEKNIAFLSVRPDNKIGYVKTARGYRRKGVATEMRTRAEAELKTPIGHSEDLSRLGRKFAEGSP